MFTYINRIAQTIRRHSLFVIVATVLCCSGLAPFNTSALAQTIVHVDKTVTNTYPSTSPPGDSWANAFKYLQDAIVYANINAGPNDEYHIWVAAGTYKPNEFASTPSNCTGTSHQRCYSFQMHDNVKWYGGFEGDETDRNQRAPLVNITILSGDIDGDNITDSDNSYHVVTANRADNTAIIDGFHVIRGYAADAPAPETGVPPGGGGGRRGATGGRPTVIVDLSRVCFGATDE